MAGDRKCGLHAPLEIVRGMVGKAERSGLLRSRAGAERRGLRRSSGKATPLRYVRSSSPSQARRTGGQTEKECSLSSKWKRALQILSTAVDESSEGNTPTSQSCDS